MNDTSRILELLGSGDGAYFTNEIAKHFGMDIRHARTILKRLEQEGQICGKTQGTSTPQRIWWIAR